MKRGKSIIYVNYSPYENSGKILDYFRENFEYVFLVSLGFYYLGEKQKSNTLIIFREGKQLGKFSLYQIPVPPKLVFVSLPIKSLLSLIQIIVWSLFLRNRYGRIEYFFSVNAFTAWIGNVLRLFGVVHRTIFWVWDYYPPLHENKIVTLMRSVYWQFDKWAMNSNRIAFVNQKLMDVRKTMGMVLGETKYSVIPIGTEKITRKIASKTRKVSLVFGFIGVLKKSHGFGIVFEYAKEIKHRFPKARYEVIGSGPDEDYFKIKAEQNHLPTKFHGYVEGNKINSILSKATIGIATYKPDAASVSHYGDPGKIKTYISLGIPVITTDVVAFAHNIKQSGAGEIIRYNNKEEFINSVSKILADYHTYQKSAITLASTLYYKKLYEEFFQ